MDDEEFIFIGDATKCGSYDTPKEKPYQRRFERIVTTDLAEVEMKRLMASDTTS